MRICILAPSYLPCIGGVEIVTFYLARGLSVSGHEIHIVTIDDTGLGNNSEIDDGIHVHRITFPFHSFFLGNGTLNNILFIIYASIAVIKIRPEIVHAQNFIPAVPAFISKVIIKVPYSICIHTEKFGLNGWGPLLPRFLRRYWAHLPYIRSADTIIALTDSTAEEIRKYFRKEPKIIPNGVDLDRFHPEKIKGTVPIFIPKIVCISRLEENKGIECALQAMKLLIPRFPKAELVVIGDGSLRKELEKEAERLGIRNNVEFLGELKNSDIPNKLIYANIYLLTSFQEGFSISILEAMASGLPIISTPVGIALNIQKKWKNGYLVPIKDPDAICNAIFQIAENQAEREKFAKYSINCVTEYSWTNIINQYEREFLRIATFMNHS